MRKNTLLLSAAVTALLAGKMAYADTTTISTSTDTMVATGDTDDDDVTGNVGNVYITSDGAIKFQATASNAITIDSDNYVYSNGLISISDKSSVRGIRVDMTTYTVDQTSFDLSDSVITTESGTTVTGAAIYLDSSSVIKLAGDSGSGKYGIWLEDSDSDCTDCILTGDIIMAEGSQITVRGSSVRGIYFEQGTELVGDLDLSGTIYARQQEATATSSGGVLYGIYMAGGIDGDVDISSTGVIRAAGAGANAAFFTGSGITGALTIEGTIIAEGYEDAENDTFDFTDKDNTYPEAGTALAIGASVGGGIVNSGTIETLGTGEALEISPALSYGSADYDYVESLVIGAYTADSTSTCYGYGLCNTGDITITPVNGNKSVTAAVYIIGGGSQYPTIIEGGIYNSGVISSSVRTFTKNPSSVSATALYISGYVDVGGSYDTDTETYTGDFVASCSSSDSGYCYYIGDEDDVANATLVGDAEEVGSIVNTGTIESYMTDGTGSASVRAIYITSDADVTSIVNTGTILAEATIKDEYTDDVTALSAYGIYDGSGSLTYIYNSGTIEALATSLDDDGQTVYAIYLSGNTAQASGDGFTLISQATEDQSAKIYGDVVLGQGDNQKIYLYGYSSTYKSYLYGDITYQASTSAGVDNGDLLYIGNYAEVDGSVTAVNGVDVEIEENGSLTMENDDTSLYVSALNVASGGSLTVSVSEQMDDDGAISALTESEVNIESGATLGVKYNSFVPINDSGTYSYLLVRADKGYLNIDSSVIESAQESINEDLPFLFSSATLETTTSSDDAYSELLLNVATKTVGTGTDQLNLTGYAAKMYSYVNEALQIDPDLGAAMINDIGDGCGTISDGECSGDTTLAEAQAEAQSAYNSYAPDLTGSVRANAVMLTDSVSGPVAERMRQLREFNKDEEDSWTLWLEGIGEHTEAKGQGAKGADGSYARNGYKEKGFGFALGADTGSPRYGWYGLSMSFYNSNVKETGRDAHNNQLWVTLSGYTSWRGRHMFLDSNIGVGYSRIRGVRYINLYTADEDTSDRSNADLSRQSDNTHAAEFANASVVFGARYEYAGFKFDPQISVDGLLLREEGYAETNHDSTNSDEQGFLLDVSVQHNRSLRTSIGSDAVYDWNLWGIDIKPALHAYYRRELINDRIHEYVAFKDVNTDVTGSQHGTRFQLSGLNPSKNNLVGGGSIGTQGDGWSVNLNLDYLRGDNGLTQEVGTFNFLVKF